jgi:hypothetical protein
MFERRLAEQHRQLEKVFQGLVCGCVSEDPIALRRRWCTFERELLEHMQEEEQRWLPAFSIKYPAEAEELRREHQEIRTTLNELGVALDLHALRAETGEAFINKLRTHAAREDRRLYLWIEEHEGPRCVLETSTS